MASKMQWFVIGQIMWRWIRYGCSILAILLFSELATDGESKQHPEVMRPPWLGDFVKCSDSPLYAKLSVPPAIASYEADLIGEMHPAAFISTPYRTELMCGLLARRWKRFPDGYIALLETAILEPSGSGGADEVYRTVAVALIRTAKDQKPVIIAKTETPYQLGKDLKFNYFDVANYRLNESMLAFGIRTIGYVGFANGGGADEFLELFQWKDGVIIHVLTTLMSSSKFAQGEVFGDERGARIQVLQHKTNGVFDLKKYTLSPKRKSAIFRWNGKEYATSDHDPVEDVNPCWFEVC